MRNELANHLEKLMTGRVSYGMPAPALGMRRFRYKQSIAVFAVDGLLPTMCFVLTVARDNRSRQLLEALLHTVRPTAKLVVTGTTELDASFILQKDSNLLGRTDPHSNIFPEIDLSRFDPETKVSRRHARIWLEGENPSSKILEV